VVKAKKQEKNGKGARRLTENVLPSRGVKRKGVNACRASAYSPTRKRSLRYPVYKPAFSSAGGLFRLGFTLRHQFVDVLFFTLLVSALVSGGHAQCGRGRAAFSVRAARARSSLFA
jgi:23S rRNA pseudouridine2604 synthase